MTPQVFDLKTHLKRILSVDVRAMDGSPSAPGPSFTKGPTNDSEMVDGKWITRMEWVVTETK